MCIVRQAGTGIEAFVKPAIGEEPGDAVARHAVEAGEVAGHHDAAIGLDGNGAHIIVEALARIEARIDGAIGPHAAQPAPRHAVVLGEIAAHQDAAIGQLGQRVRGPVQAGIGHERRVHRTIRERLDDPQLKVPVVHDVITTQQKAPIRGHMERETRVVQPIHWHESVVQDTVRIEPHQALPGLVVEAGEDTGHQHLAIGLQGHYEIDRLPLEEIEATIEEVKKLGLKVVVSELDIDMVPRGRWWADGGKYRDELAKVNPYPEGLSEDLLKKQADQYAALFRIFAKHSDAILRVSFWNLHDGESWLNYFPWNRVNHPLLFDRQRQPKPAFWAVLEALQVPH